VFLLLGVNAGNVWIIETDETSDGACLEVSV